MMRNFYIAQFQKFWKRYRREYCSKLSRQTIHVSIFAAFLFTATTFFILRENPEEFMTSTPKSVTFRRMMIYIDPFEKYAIVSTCIQSKVFTKGFIKASFENKQEYCDHHEDTECFLSSKVYDSNTHAKWNKLSLLMEVMENQNIELILYRNNFYCNCVRADLDDH